MLAIRPHPELHPLFEVLGFVLGFVTFKRRTRGSGDVVNPQQRWNIIAGALIGALVGSRLLGLLEQMPRMAIVWSQFFTPAGGKSVVGGLLGGWLAVELTKKISGIHTRTGDAFAIPLCVGIAIGRVGCLLAGLADDTYGKPTSLPWGVDFGDGIARHPTQAYEIVFLVLLALVLKRMAQRPHPEGSLFRVFLGSYLAWRLLVDCLKPEPLIFGLNAVQWASLLGLFLLAAKGIRSHDGRSTQVG